MALYPAKPIAGDCARSAWQALVISLPESPDRPDAGKGLPDRCWQGSARSSDQPFIEPTGLTADNANPEAVGMDRIDQNSISFRDNGARHDEQRGTTRGQPGVSDLPGQAAVAPPVGGQVSERNGLVRDIVGNVDFEQLILDRQIAGIELAVDQHFQQSRRRVGRAIDDESAFAVPAGRRSQTAATIQGGVVADAPDLHQANRPSSI